MQRMITDQDLEDAVKEGVITPGHAKALRGFAASRTRAVVEAPSADEERFRLVASFNDIFVVLACALVLVSSFWLVGDRPGGVAGAGLLVVSWLLAEVFVRQRRMALPAIVLTAAALAGAALAALGAAALFWPESKPYSSWIMLAAVLIVAALHAWRFRVPITSALAMAAVTAALVHTALAYARTMTPTPGSLWSFPWLPMLTVLACGVAAFAWAMAWDVRDRARTSHRNDIAFWLHLLAAPLLVYPCFLLVAVALPNQPALQAAIVVGAYALLALLSLVIDRRALLVSALGNVLFALTRAFTDGSSDGGSAALKALPIIALVAGSVLLLLSIFWGSARRAVMKLAPTWVRVRVPVERG
jgi:MFS family permease